MEKFQIAKYGMMQVTAIVYGILACGAAVKYNRAIAEMGHPMPDVYYRAVFYREHGIWMLGVIMAWAILISYLSSPLSKWDFEDEHLYYSGLALALIYAIVGTYLGFGAFAAPTMSFISSP